MRRIIPALAILSAFSLAGCANYDIGDITRAYCSTPAESRAVLNQLASDAGVSVPDYCASYGITVMVVGSTLQVVKDSVDVPK